MPEGTLTVSHRLECDSGHITHQRHGGVDYGVSADVVLVRQTQQHFSDVVAIGQREIAYTTDPV